MSNETTLKGFRPISPRFLSFSSRKLVRNCLTGLALVAVPASAASIDLRLEATPMATATSNAGPGFVTVTNPDGSFTYVRPQYSWSTDVPGSQDLFGIKTTPAVPWPNPETVSINSYLVGPSGEPLEPVNVLPIYPSMDVPQLQIILPGDPLATNLQNPGQSIANIPEPTTTAMISLGLGLLGLGARRKRSS